jgi:hypothetical protein
MSKVQVTYDTDYKYTLPIELKIGQWWYYRDSKKWDWPSIPDEIYNEVGGFESAVGHAKDQICIISIEDIIESDFGGEEIKIKFKVVDDRFCPYDINETAWFVDSNFSFEDNHFFPLWDPDEGLIVETIGQREVEYGADCVACNRNYPYAVKVFGFKCWGCENGY